MPARSRPVREFMSRVVRTIDLATPLTHALTVMREGDIRHLPVLDRDQLVGLVSERDLEILQAHRLLASGQASVADAMSNRPYQVEPDVPLQEVARVMAEEKYGAAIVTENGVVVGLFTTTDALRLVEREIA